MKHEQKICEGQVIGVTLTNGISEQRQTLVLKVVGIPKGIEVDKLLGKISIYKQFSVEQYKESLKKKEDFFSVMRDSTMNFTKGSSEISFNCLMRRPPEYRHPVKGDDTPVHGQIDVKHIRPRDAGLNSNLFSRKAKDKQYRRTPESVGITIASYYKRSEDATYIGIACCGRGDNFSKHKGRELARSRSTDKEEYLIVKGFRTFDEIIRYICLYSQHITPFYKKLLISYARKKKLGKAE